MIFKAIEFAARAHAGQYRKQTRIPYIIHPLSVARLLIQEGCDETLIVAAVLHDTVEDTDVTIADIESGFGAPVAELVAFATEPDKRHPWEMRKQHTLDSISDLPQAALLLICADKLDNLRSIREDIDRLGDAIWERFSRPKEKQRWYFEALLQAFRARLDDRWQSPLFAAFEKEVKRVFG